MPFTLSHPAAVGPLWPLARRLRLPLAALVIGAMAPDFEFFLHLRSEARWSHSLGGLFAFCLPVGVAVYLAWEGFARTPMRSLLALPTTPADRSETWRMPRWWARAAGAVLIGAATHLVWDGFTHGNYWGAHRWPGLLSPAITVRGRDVPWFNLLQHVSTALGGAVVIAWLGTTLRRADAFARLRRSRWRVGALACFALSALALGVWNGSRSRAPSDFWTFQVAVGRVAIGALLGLALAMLAFSAVFRWRRGMLLAPRYERR
jgi:Domain of unknown function (DUF4184)